MKVILTLLVILVLSGCSSNGASEKASEVQDVRVFQGTDREKTAVDKASELHGVGVYQGIDPKDDGIPWHQKCGDKNPMECHQAMTQKMRNIGGQVVVNVSITDKPLILAFSAYDKTNWIVNAEDGVLIEKVILSGYHSQSVEGVPQETPIEVYTYDSSPCAKCYQGSGYFYSYKGVPGKLKGITGLSVSSWQSKYEGEEFSIFPKMNRLEPEK